ncbi:hypothetical protein MU582_16240 [Nocardioidaceae bacterium SCSIO 66511]|nr:hypothetical protein MU582_16240 [Nocardioidaceae bacterium SCSIO 66511]
MHLPNRSTRVRLAMLTATAVAASLTLGQPTSSADNEQPRDVRPTHVRAQAVVSKPLAKPPKGLRDLRQLAEADRSMPEPAWSPSDAALADVAATLGERKPWQNRVPRKKMPRSVGKLYTYNDGAFGECSAFAVRDRAFPKKRSFVVTAGHCLVDPKTKDWKDVVEFYPKYYGKKGSPYGGWDAKRLLTYDKWYNKGKWTHDIGVVRLQHFKGKQIVDRVGGNRLAYGAKPRDKRVRFIGYPAAGRYDGKFPYQCVGSARRDAKRKWMTVMPCATREGASGGPWFKKMLNRNTGVAYAALSRGTSSGKRIITAPTFKKSLRRITFKKKW